MRKYVIHTYSAIKDLVRAGHPIPKESTTRFIISNKTQEEIEAYPDHTDAGVWATAIFPINSMQDEEMQESNAKLLCNYLNKVAEAQEKARLGAEIGFLN